MSSGSGKGGLRLWDVTTSDRNEVELNLHCLIGYWCVAVLAVLTQLDINQTLICPCLHTEGEHETLRFKTVFIYFQVIKQKTTEGYNPKDSNNAKKGKTPHLLSVVFNESFDHKLQKCVFHGCVLYKSFLRLGTTFQQGRTHRLATLWNNNHTVFVKLNVTQRISKGLLLSAPAKSNSPMSALV